MPQSGPWGSVRWPPWAAHGSVRKEPHGDIREAAARHQRLIMTDLLKENQRLEVDLRGLKT